MTSPILAEPPTDDLPCQTADDPDLWFPERHELARIRLAKELCAACPARAACLAGALARNELHGIWGGLTPAQRAALQRQHPCRQCQAPCPLVSPYCGDLCRRAARAASVARYEARRAYRRAA